MDRLVTSDPDLLTFLVEQVADQESVQAATLLATLTSHTGTPASVRASAEAALARLAERGIHPSSVGPDGFDSGWVQQGRERGEQIMILGWRQPDDQHEAMVFLLDWRGDGLKDYYRTRTISKEEWRQLLEHTGAKGVPLVEITLAEGRALLEAAIAEGKRFSRPLPREYRLERESVEHRVLQAVETPATLRPFVSPTLTPEEVVAAYVAALHYRDYALAALLLAPEHHERAGRDSANTAEALRAQHKQGARREADVAVERTPANQLTDATDRATVDAQGGAISVDRTGRRTRVQVRERYSLHLVGDRWLIAGVEPVA